MAERGAVRVAGRQGTPRREIRRSVILPRRFYSAPPDVVARRLLGKVLVRPAEPENLAGRIVEVEAYFGGEDPAAHTFIGKTARNAVLFGPPGHAYVYFIYGMYSCLNVSCGARGQAGGVLFRALEPLTGLAAMSARRWPPGREPTSRSPFALTSGPGRICQAFGITRAADNDADFTSTESDLQIHDDGFVAGPVLVTPRIGIRKAADRLARYVLAGNLHVSKVPAQAVSKARP